LHLYSLEKLLKSFLNIFFLKSGKYFPCKKCGAHFLKRLATHPLNISSRAGITQYLCQLHNEVNIMTNKTLFDCENNLTATYGGKCGCEEEEAANNNTSVIDANNISKKNSTSSKDKENEGNNLKKDDKEKEDDHKEGMEDEHQPKKKENQPKAKGEE
jgi:hypothetical protein